MEILIAAALEALGGHIGDIDTLLLAEWFNDFPDEEPLILGRRFTPIMTSHHRNHIGTVLPSGLTDFVAVVADGGSEDGTTKIYEVRDGAANLISDHDDDIITGKFYGTITQMVVDPDHRLSHQSYPGKLMGLAPLGEWSDELSDLIDAHASALNTLHDDCSGLREIFGLSDDYAAFWTDRRRRDLAHTAQEIWIQRFMEVIGSVANRSSAIALSGGCALNIQLNERIRRSRMFEHVYVPPVANDSGQSLGAVLSHDPTIACDYPFLGRTSGRSCDAPYKLVTDDLLAGRVVAFCEGRAEIGPRALGNRSLFALPNSMDMHQRLSVEVKGREAYRPLAPTVLEDQASVWFDIDVPSPYMTFAPQTRAAAKSHIPAAIHIDGSARIQTVARHDGRSLSRILEELERRGHPPIVLNSSFNLSREAMVDSYDDAVRVYRTCGADILYLNGVRVS